MKKKALCIGARGMDASNLIKFLLDKNYEVIGTDRRSSSPNYWRHEELGIIGKYTSESMDLTDFASVAAIIDKYKPNEVYNLGAMSFVQESFSSPVSTFNVNANGQLNVLEAVRKFSPLSKVFFAATSEMFGKVQEVPQKESTPFYPRSPYGVSKLAGFELTRNYRESYGMFACSAITFNHEGKLRSPEFVTRKITQSIAKWYYNKLDSFELGNVSALRDWGSSEDYIEAMWLMLQQNIPDDFVIATNEMHSVREFITECFKYLNLMVCGIGEGVNEKFHVEDINGYRGFSDEPVITISEKYFRPCEVDQLLGCYEKAKEKLGWSPKTKFKELVHKMMEADLEREKE